MALQIRRGINSQRLALSGVDTPVVGEPLFTTDTKKLFIGDGVTAGGVSLGYYGSIEVSGQGTLSAANNTDVLTLVAGTNIDITTDPETDTVTINAAATFTELQNESIRIYQNNIVGLNSNEDIVMNPSGSGKVDIVGNLNVSGAITGNLTGNVTGNVSGNAGTITSQANSATITASSTNTFNQIVLRDSSGNFSASTITANLTGNVTGNVSGNAGTITSQANSATITASSTNTFNQIVLRDASGNFSASTITANLTGNVTGNITGNVTGFHTGDVKGSVFADDSTILVDAVNGVLTGNLIGNVTGNITGNFSNQEIEIIENRIRTINSNQSIILDPSGSGDVRMNANLVSSGLQIFGPGVSGASGNGSITVVTQDPAAIPLNVVEIHETANFAGAVSFSRSRGTPLSPTAIQNNDTINQLIFSGYDGSTFLASASIIGTVNGAVSSNVVPGKLEFAIADSAGTYATRFNISSTEVSALVPFKLPVVADDLARSTLVPTPAQGMLIFMQSGTTPAATNQAQVFDGTNWVNL